MKRFILLTFALCIQFADLNAGNLEKAFERLAVYDYFNAKELFIKSLKRDPAAAGYGLSKIYSTPDNPFYHLDSARVYFHLSDSLFPLLKLKQQQEYDALGVSLESIRQLKDSICTKALLAAESSASLGQLDHYLNHFPFCGSRDQATALRNSIAFQEARSVNTAAAYSEFLDKYPSSEEAKDALNRYHERVFEEQTESHQLGAYERFLEAYPESPYRMQAERMIYELSTSQGIMAEYKAFIKRYPDNRYVREAWREIYRISMNNYDEQTYLQFKFDFPDYPFMDELENDYKRQTSLFLPFKQNSLWGFINETGEEMIAAVYDEVNYFSEGLAAVSKNGKYGYINKSGKVMIPFMFDDAEAFKNNSAVVSKQDKFGLLSRTGEFLIPLEYEELTDPVEDICVVMKNGRAGYIEKTGKAISKLEFDMATDFVDGFAIVGEDDKFGLLNSKGNLVIETEYDHLSWASSEILKAENNGNWGLINRVGEILVPLAYDAIGDFHDDRALVSLNGKCGFVNTKGLIIIPLSYRFTENLLGTAEFSNGYVAISLKGKNTILDTAGVKIQFPGYENIGLPAEGLIPVQKNRKWGYVDYSGRLKIPCTFREAYSFSGPNAIVRTESGSGVIDNTGKYILSPEYEDISRSGSHFILSLHGMYGVASNFGMLIAPCEYDRVEVLFDQVVMGQLEDTRIYFDIKNAGVIWGNKRR
jgi:hypothetical protein